MKNKTFRVESANWAYFINIDESEYEKTGDMAIEAMTRALEDCMEEKYEKFTIESEEELMIDPLMTAFCDKEKSDDEEEFICLTHLIFQNAGFFELADTFKKYMEND